MVESWPVRVERATRRFGARVALDGVDLTVEPGEIVGLAGPNGSGKTTLLRLLAGLLRADSGSVAVFGRDPATARAAVMTRARFVFAPPALFERLTAREHLMHLASIRTPAMSKTSARDVARALATVGLAERADDPVGAFSFGMRQRLALALALLPLPDLLVLDEPSDGLDPMAVLELRAILAGLRRDHGVAVLLSSHLMLELDVLVDRLLVLDGGRTLYYGTPAALTADGETIVIETADPARAAALLAEHGVRAETNGDAGLVLPRDSIGLDEAHALFRSAGIALDGFARRRATLEQALIDRLRGRGRSA